MEEDRMSNITLKILDLTGDTVLADLADADTVRAEVNVLDGYTLVCRYCRSRFVAMLFNIDIAENATVPVTRQMVAGSV